MYLLPEDLAALVGVAFLALGPGIAVIFGFLKLVIRGFNKVRYIYNLIN